MKKPIVAVAVGGVWLVAIASAVSLIYILNRPLVLDPGAAASWRAKVLETRPERPSAEPESTVLVIPTIFIVATPWPVSPASSERRGVAEMQKAP
jgi:hypothetical protein